MPAMTKRLSESVINLPCYLADTLMNVRFIKFYIKRKQSIITKWKKIILDLFKKKIWIARLMQNKYWFSLL